jgi:cytochrome c peroxidase
MKKLIFLLLPDALIACRQQDKATDVPTTGPVFSKNDSLLMDQARLFFKPLPGRANSSENPVTASKIKLGQVLFYDPRLSKSGHNSCNTYNNLSGYGVDNLEVSMGDAGNPGD